jgi:hypothetical protein
MTAALLLHHNARVPIALINLGVTQSAVLAACTCAANPEATLPSLHILAGGLIPS